MQLDYENLKKYVNTVLQLEKEKMVLENTYSKMVKKRDSLGKYVQLPEPPKKQRIDAGKKPINGATVCYLITFITLLAMLSNILKSEGKPNPVYIIGFLTIIIASTALGIRINHFAYKKLENESKRLSIEDYNKRYNEYNKIVIEDTKRRDRELALIPQMNNDINIIVDQYNKTNELLKSYYSLDVIYPSYHGDFVALAMFSQYLNMGMCYTLTGHEGCYTLYEQQKLQGIIITKLNVIISQLNEISGQLRSLQYSLLQAISETNEKIDKLTVYAKEQGNLQQQHNAVMEYKADCMESEMKFHNQYVMFRDLINK